MAKHEAISRPLSNKQKRTLLAARRAQRAAAAAPATTSSPAQRAATAADRWPGASWRPWARLDGDEAAWRRAAADAALAASRRHERGGADLLARLARFEPLDLPGHSPWSHARDLLARARDAGALAPAVRLLAEVPGAVDLVAAGRRGDHVTWLLGLARHAGAWLRAPGAFVRPTRNARRTLAALTRHLLARWPVPAVLDGAWPAGDARQQGWWVHVASGQNLRTAPGLPLSLTKRAAHLALEAPADVTVDQALRWGQARALGADARLARTVLGTRLGRTVGEHEDFWESVLRFLVAHPLLDPAQVGPVVDYLNAQKFVVPAGEAAPPQPGLSMRDRQPRALLAQVAAWHRQLGRAARRGAPPPTSWAPDPALGPWTHQVHGEAGPLTYEVVWLCSSSDLQVEGLRLHHCVATYAWSCAAGHVAIGSLRRREPPAGDGARRTTSLLTLEVDRRTRAVVQARGKRNALPTRAEWALLERWARSAAVQLSAWLRT